MKIFSITNSNKEYCLLSLNWAQALHKLGINDYMIYCLDDKSFDYLCSYGINCELMIEYRNFHNKMRGISINKRELSMRLIRNGLDFIFCDTDAIWIKDIRPIIENQLKDNDLVFSTYPSHPKFSHPLAKANNYLVGGYCFCSVASMATYKWLNSTNQFLQKGRNFEYSLNSKVYQSKKISTDDMGEIFHGSNDCKIKCLSSKYICSERLTDRLEHKDGYILHLRDHILQQRSQKNGYDRISILKKKGLWFLDNDF